MGWDTRGGGREPISHIIAEIERQKLTAEKPETYANLGSAGDDMAQVLWNPS
jgi:hypothetical protein